MSEKLDKLKVVLDSMSIEAIDEYTEINYGCSITGTKGEIINKIIKHEANKPDGKYIHKTASESYYGEVLNIEDIGDFVNKAISEFKKSNVTPVSKVLIEIDEILGDLVFIQGYEIKVINVDLQNEFKVGDINA